MKPLIPRNETQRLEALRSYHILDTAAEQLYDDITSLAAHICKVPMATISLVDESRQWFKSRLGIREQETPRDISFCAHAILQKDPLIVRDASVDPRFQDSPLVTEEPHIRFYAGFPLITPEGMALGSLCAIDRQPRELSAEQTTAMHALARQVMALLAQRRNSHQLAEALEEVKTLQSLLPICSWCKRIRDEQGNWGEVETYIQAHTNTEFTHGICPDCLAKVAAAKSREKIKAA